MSKFNLEIITPEKSFYKGEVLSLTVETPAGSLGILAHHIPMAIGLKPALIKINTGEEQLTAVCGEGFVQVGKDVTMVLCQTMEWPHEIEINKVRREIEEHQRKVLEARNRVEYKLGQAALARLFAKLRIK